MDFHKWEHIKIENNIKWTNILCGDVRAFEVTWGRWKMKRKERAAKLMSIDDLFN